MSAAKRPRQTRNSFIQIANQIKERIQSGVLHPGRYLPTEKELQEEFKCSRSTIRRALSALIDEGWALNIPNKGVVVSSGKTNGARNNNIAFIVDDTYVLRVLHVRMGQMLQEKGYHLVHLGSAGNKRTIEEQLEYACEQGFSAALVESFRGYPDPDLLGQLCRRLPVVALDHRIHGVNTDLVSFDYFEAGYESTSQLCRQGRKRIAVTGMMDMLQTTHDRFSGYMKALFEFGLSPHSRDFVFSVTSASTPNTSPLVNRLLQEDRPDAIFVLQDSEVPYIVEAVLNAGLRIPEDIAISTIGDDIDLMVGDKALTTVATDWDTFAVEAVNLLLQRIEDPARVPLKRFAPHQLVVRGLCGAPQDQWSGHAGEFAGFHGEVPIARSKYRYHSGRLLSDEPSGHSQLRLT